MPVAFWDPKQEIPMNLVAALVDVMEAKKPRLVKPCTVVLKEITKKLGGSKNLEECITLAINFV
jgi:hypothetical protein